MHAFPLEGTLEENMTPADEGELHRLSNMLATLNRDLANDSPLREGLAKAGLALGFAFIDGRRAQIEHAYRQLDSSVAALTDEQRAHLAELGIDPAT